MSPYSEDRKQPWGAVVVVIAVLIFGGIVLGYVIHWPCPPFCTTTPTPTVSPGTTEPTPPTSENQVVVSFYTSDTIANWVRDVTEKFNAAQFQTSAGKVITVTVTQGDSLDQMEAIQNGQAQPTAWSLNDMSWVSQFNTDWETKHGHPLMPINECTPVIQAAIGFGMWQPMAQAMGWPNTPVGWQEILGLANDPQGWARYGHPEWGQFKFGHTHPSLSNAGRVALTSLAYWTLGQTDGLTYELAKSPEVVAAIRQLELHTYHYGTSTRQLSTRMAQLGPNYLHAFTTVESTVLMNNKEFANKRFPFVFIPPADGAFWPDNPYCFIAETWVKAEQREAAEIYREFLLAEEQQRRAMTHHGLRPINPAMPLECLICLPATDPSDNAQTIPGLTTVSGQVGEAITEVFIETKKKAFFVVALDISGSMEGTKIISATEATANFLGVLAELDKDAEVYILTFNDQVTLLTPNGRVGEVAEPLGKVVTTVFAAGGTALYDAICEASALVKQQQIADALKSEQRLYGVVVLSDGKDTSSQHTDNDVRYDCLPDDNQPEAAVSIPVYTIAYGADANKDLLEEFADLSYGRFYVADENSIEDIYFRIAFEQ